MIKTDKIIPQKQSQLLGINLTLVSYRTLFVQANQVTRPHVNSHVMVLKISLKP